MTRDEISEAFPALVGRFDMTSSPDDAYNCISWAFNDTLQYWWPTDFSYPGMYWPPVSRDVAISSFVAAFEYFGFRKCSSREFEDGYDKIALYADALGTPTHAARWWQEDGGWSSKLGEENDIRHHTLESLEDSEYGKVVQVFKRRRLYT